MSFISYAQNFEDVMLWRALKHIENGFYIDVGAAWPDEDSVTKAFYDNGWRGINIEPNIQHYHALELHRPEDKNLQLAVGECAGQLDMSMFAGTGLSTLDAEIGLSHREHGFDREVVQISVITLAEVFYKYIPPEKDVHFMKVDVEGLEKAVLLGNNWGVFRPWVVVVEATLPMTQIESHGEWEPILLSADYIFAYADGLNRFYVAKEHANLLPAFKYPPNIFDGFKSSEWQAVHEQLVQEQSRVAQFEIRIEQAEYRAEQAEVRAEQAEVRAERAEARTKQSEDRAEKEELRAVGSEQSKIQLAMQLDAVYASTSWRISAPVRWCGTQLKLLTQHGLKKRLKAFLIKVVKKFISFINSQPRWRSRVVRLVRCVGAENILKRFYWRVQSSHFTDNTELLQVPIVISEAGHRASQIYHDLKHTIEQKKKAN